MSSSAANRAPASPDAVDLGAVVRATLRRLPLLALAALLVGAVAASILSTMAPKFLSQAQLEVRSAGAGDGGRPDKEAVGTHVRSLMSTSLALAMSNALKLTQRPEFNSALPPADLFGRTLRSLEIGSPKAGETDEDRLMQAYFQNVRAYQVRDTRSIIVDCTTTDAKFSADCANRLADLYRDSLRGRTASEGSDLRVKLKPEVDRVTRETAEAEARASEFRAKANLFVGGTQSVQIKDQQLGELTQELTRLAAVRSEAEARAAAARELAARDMAAANPDVQKSALIPQMEEQRVSLERQIAELSATLLPGHPRMKQLISELASLRAQIRAEVQKVVESLGNDARIAAAREDRMRRRVDEMKETVMSSAPDSARLAQFENDAKSKRAELERLQGQYEKAASTAGSGAGDVEIEIVSRAYPSNEKVFPKIGSMSAFTAFSTFVLGLAGVLMRELVRGARPEAPRVDSLVAAAAGSRVAMPRANFVPRGVSPSPRASPEIEAAAASVSRLCEDGRGLRVLVSARTVGVDVAAVVLPLAAALANGGKRVVAIAWAGTGDDLARRAGVDGSTGSADLVVGNASIEDVVQRPAGAKYDVVAAGSGAGSIDADTALIVLDTFDDLYDIALVAAPTAEAAQLFELVQGRFDAGVLAGALPPAPAVPGPTQFLGFEVDDFPVVHVAVPSTRTTTSKFRPTLKRAPSPAGS